MNDDKAQFALVCLNIDISHPVPRSITMTSGLDSSEFFLTYEGVHEVCPLCGAKDHFLNLCPKKPAPCLDLVVAKLESSNIASPTDPDWISVRPQRRQRSRYPHRPPRNLPYKHLAPLQPIPSLLCPETLPPTSPPSQPPPLIPTTSPLPTTNAFATLAEFQISCDEGFCLQPPPVETLPPGHLDHVPDPTSDDDDIDAAFLQALGVIHHNPHLSFDAEMSDQLSPIITSPTSAGPQSPRDTTKRRKREDAASPCTP